MDIARVYPDAAIKRKLEGVSRMACHVTQAGDIHDCRLVAELPQGVGFGEATLKLVPLFKAKPGAQPIENLPITVRFLLPSDTPKPPAPLTRAMRCYGLAYEATEQNSRSSLAWNRMNYWSGQVLIGVANSGYAPSDYEAALAFARLPKLPNSTAAYDTDCAKEGPQP